MSYEQATEIEERLQERIAQLENALKWIRLHAGLHYAGQAFEPEHMRALANLAADALLPEWTSDRPTLPEFDAAMYAAEVDAAELAERLFEYIDVEDEASDDHA